MPLIGFCGAGIQTLDNLHTIGANIKPPLHNRCKNEVIFTTADEQAEWDVWKRSDRQTTMARDGDRQTTMARDGDRQTTMDFLDTRASAGHFLCIQIVELLHKHWIGFLMVVMSCVYFHQTNDANSRFKGAIPNRKLS